MKILDKYKIYNYIKANKISLDEDVFIYGFQILVDYLVFILIIMIVSIYLNIVKEVIVFILAFIPLRRYLGGFHFSKNYLCKLFSILFTVLFSLISKSEIVKSFFIICIIFIISIIVTYTIGVRDHKNKRLADYEKNIYRKKSLCTELLYFILCCFLFVFSIFDYLNIIIMSLIFSIGCIVSSKIFYKNI